MKINEIKKTNNKNIKDYVSKFGISRFKKQNPDVGIYHYKLLKNKPILFVENLYKRYPRKKQPAINHISFNVYPGQFHAFIGANGAGKTTSIKSIIGAYSLWEGTVLINGKKNTSVAAKKRLGYIPENARFPAKMSCYSYLVWMARLSGVEKEAAKKFAEAKLKELNLKNLRNKSPNSFSSGQKKKVLLAQALINDPDILVMDEPAANLDPKARIELFEKLGKLQKQGKAILISSHVLAELDKYANAATILDGGKIVFTGTTKELFDKYAERKINIRVDKPKPLLDMVKKNKISCKSLGDNKFEIDFLNKEEEIKLFELVTHKQINLLSYVEIGNQLDDIYKKLIKFGSVDTMGKGNEK